jgi:hypothetical protein
MHRTPEEDAMLLRTIITRALVLVLSTVTLCSPLTTGAQEASPVATEAMWEPIVTTTVAPEDLPEGDRLKFEIWHATIEPDVDVTMAAEPFTGGAGTRIEHVVAGTLTLRVEGALQVVRADAKGTPGPVEEITPGTDVVLQAGDTALFAQKLAMSYANRGAEPVRLIGGQLVALGGTLTQGDSSDGYTVNVTDERDLTEPLAPGPVTFELERVTLAPGAILPAPPAGALRVMTSGPSVVYLAKASDGSVSNVLKEPVVTYVLTLLPAGAVTGPREATPTASD